MLRRLWPVPTSLRRLSALRNLPQPATILRPTRSHSSTIPQRSGVIPWSGAPPSAGATLWFGETRWSGVTRWFGETPLSGVIRWCGATPWFGEIAKVLSETANSTARQSPEGGPAVSRLAKAYITLVIVSGALILLLAAGSWSSTNLRQFAICLGLAALASTLKVRIPGIEGTMSPNFVFLLLGMVALPFAQVAVTSLTAALVQSLWASAKRPRLAQVAFSAAALVISSALAYKFAHLFLAENATGSRLVSVILAGSAYFPLNSILVSMVVGLVEGRPLKQISRRCYQWVFPYFGEGIAFAALVSSAYAPSTLWKGALVLLPTMVLAFVYFFNRSGRSAVLTTGVSSSEEERFLSIGGAKLS